MQTYKIPMPLKGVDKLSNETTLKKNTWRTAENVDIDRGGQVNTREGYAKLLVGSDYHSAYYAPQRSWLLTGKGSKLMLVNRSAGTETQLFDSGAMTLFSYTEYNGNLYVLSGNGLRWFPQGQSTPLACGTAAPTPPVVSASSAGGLHPGTYGVLISVIDERGGESAACTLQTISLPNGGGIQLSGLPYAPGSRVAIYTTSANDDVLHLYATPPATLTTHLVSALPQGAQCSTQFLSPFTGGQFVRWHNARLYVASGDTLYYSDAFRPHLTNLATNFIQFSEEISFIEPTMGGIYVGDARGVWFLDGGDPVKFVLKRTSGCLAVRGSSAIVPSEHFDPKVVQTNLPVAVWLSTSGYAVGTASGEVIELNYDTIRVSPGLVGSTAFSIRQGRKQLITLTSARTNAAGLAEDSIT